MAPQVQVLPPKLMARVQPLELMAVVKTDPRKLSSELHMHATVHTYCPSFPLLDLSQEQ